MKTPPVPPSGPGASRREFLSRSAAAAAGIAAGCTSVTASSESARDGKLVIPKAHERVKLGPNDPIKMGFIGTGGMANGHIDSTLDQIKNGLINLQIVALADVCKPRLDKTLEKVKAGQPGVDVTAYRNYHDLLSRDDIHCVLIATPEHWHAQHVVDAIAAGKDAYCEKPMTLRLPQAIWLRDLMTANPDMRLQIGTQYLMFEKYHLAKKLIAEGAIGHPISSQTSYCRNVPGGEWLYEIDPKVVPGEMLDWEAWCGPAGLKPFDTKIYHRWRRYRDFSTGIVGDLLVHMMTPLVFALDAGWPTRVSAIGGHYIDKEMENHDQVNLTIQFEKEHTMVVAGATNNELGTEVIIRGQKGNLMLNGNNCVLKPEQKFVDEVDPQDLPADNSNEQPRLRLDFWNAVRTREQNLSQVEYATKIMVIVDLATRAMWEGKTFDFDPKSLKVTSA
jgi:predicted dehydrogenase